MKAAVKVGQLFTTAYLLIMFCIYPFYIQDGYNNIGQAKYEFFKYVTLAAFLLLFMIAIIIWLLTVRQKSRLKQPYIYLPNSISATDFCMLAYGAAVFLSFILSEFREEAWKGTEGWYMGCMLQLLLIGMYFLISRIWKYHKGFEYACLGSSFIVFLLGICNRFSFYPIPFKETQPDFISTLGNINWFCGYFSVLFPIGACMFVCGQKKSTQIISGAYILIASMAGFSQGSSSIFLIFGGVLYLLFLVSLSKRKWLRQWIVLVGIWMLSSQAVRIVRNLFPQAYNYNTNTLCGYLTDSGVLLLGALLIAAVYVIYSSCIHSLPEEEGVRRAELLIKIMIILPVGSFLLWLLLAWINTVWGIKALTGYSLFALNTDWGNGRGAAISAGLNIYTQLPITAKIFGAGPDCFSKYAYSIPEINKLLKETFGSFRLTNAHNELLTSLVNVGAAGVVFYIGIFATAIARFVKRGLHSPAMLIPAVCAFSYLMHNMVSFAQVLNTSFVFIMLGIGESMIRKEKSNL